MKYSVPLRVFAIVLPALLASCAKPAYQVRGYASYIAEQYAGRYTSSGAIYQPMGWTAAHNTLPFGTVVKVKNNYNGRTVNVTVNDRFPSYPNRVINLSRAAAQELQIPYQQLGDVTVTAKTVAGGPATAGSYNTAPASTYTSAPPAGYPASGSYYGAPPAPKTPSYPNKAGTVPPAGYGTSAPPAGIPPPPPGYR
ncbi:septal ring lytic transglycosylase RlpA family protein [Prosthecobacter fluviatilis]|uniref:Septal ring lytic transglycosylase RlpA family protein n=1 Tax=Prosthecobacter fluviatilis TaxID=445931 RepID=A0ABW0KP30_9BACT